MVAKRLCASKSPTTLCLAQVVKVRGGAMEGSKQVSMWTRKEKRLPIINNKKKNSYLIRIKTPQKMSVCHKTSLYIHTTFPDKISKPDQSVK